MTAAVPAAPQPPPAPGIEVTHDPEVPVRFVQIWLCDLCLDGMGGECHTPGCALWLNRAPDIQLRDSPAVTIMDSAPQAAPSRPLTAPDVVAGLLADVAGSRAQLADAAPELAAAMAETRTVRDGYASLCREFGPSPQSGWSARVSLTSLNRHRDRAGLPGLPRNAAAGEREDVTMRYRRERDEARAQLAEVRKLAESWAGRAPGTLPIAMQFTMSPHDTVSSDCGRELLAGLDADAADSSVYSVAVERASAAETFRQCATELRTRLTAARDIARTATRERQQAAAGLQEVHDALAAAWPGKDLAEGAEAILVAALARERDEYAELLVAGDAERAALQRDRDKLTAQLAARDKALEALDRVVISHARSMYAASIDVRHGDPGDADPILFEALDGFDGPKWDGTETGIQWLERTREADGG